MIPFLKNRWFSGRNTKDLKDLNDRLANLEKMLQQLTDKRMDYSVTIENMHVHHPVLESLTFRLDRLNIDELSGALNLGNNFGVKVGRSDTGSASTLGSKNETDTNIPTKGEFRTTSGGFSFKPD